MPRAYAPRLCRRVIDLIDSGRSVAEVAAMIELTKQTTYNWWNRHLGDTGRRAGTTSIETSNCSPSATGSQNSRGISPQRALPTSC